MLNSHSDYLFDDNSVLTMFATRTEGEAQFRRGLILQQPVAILEPFIFGEVQRCPKGTRTLAADRRRPAGASFSKFLEDGPRTVLQAPKDSTRGGHVAGCGDTPRLERRHLRDAEKPNSVALLDL